MPIYQSTGQLTDAIPHEHVEAAQAYLAQDDMTQYVDESIAGAVERVEWRLHHNGRDYTVEAVTSRELTDDELRVLAEWTSGQNSDGLGECFEQQDFAWVEGPDPDEDEDEDYYEDGHMVSFDWKTNKSTFTRVA